MARILHLLRHSLRPILFFLILIIFLVLIPSQLILPNMTSITRYGDSIRLILLPTTTESPMVVTERLQEHRQRKLWVACERQPITKRAQTSRRTSKPKSRRQVTEVGLYNMSSTTSSVSALPRRDIPKHLAHQVLVNRNNSLLYCYIPKTGCTNWRRVFGALAGDGNLTKYMEIPQDDVHEKLYIPRLTTYPQTERRKMLDNYFTFVFVREPYARILSAFLDKFVQNYPNRYFTSYYAIILRKYRGWKNVTVQNVSKLVHQPNFTFTEFVTYLVDKGRSRRTFTFEPHWERYHKLCQPCDMRWHFIGHLETMAQDARYLLDRLNLSHGMVSAFPDRASTGYSSGGAEKRMLAYYEKLPPHLLDGLRELYRLDFEIFGYDPDLIHKLLDNDFMRTTVNATSSGRQNSTKISA